MCGKILCVTTLIFANLLMKNADARKKIEKNTPQGIL